MPNIEYARVPMTLLKTEGQRLRPAMEVITEIRQGLRSDLGPPEWPSWCFYPKAEAVDAVRTYMDVITPPLEEDWSERDIWDDGELAATLLAWRLTRGVYEFDPDLFHTLTETKISDEIPSELLYRLPEWCVYIATPSLRDEFGRSMEGFFARLNYGNQNTLHADDPDGHALTFMTVYRIPDREQPERSLMTHSFEVSLRYRSLREGIYHYQPDFYETTGQVWDTPEQRRERVHRLAAQYAPYLNLVLYLCSEKPEIAGKGQPGNPKPIKTKKGWREFPASGTRFWNVGARIGATLRKENTSARNEERDPVTGRTRPRPHIRRAHWNTYWTGPKTAPQTPVLRWIPPTLVAADPNSDEELPTTIRPVKE